VQLYIKRTTAGWDICDKDKNVIGFMVFHGFPAEWPDEFFLYTTNALDQEFDRGVQMAREEMLNGYDV
jgi:hypothetical protein